jgi:hypothetical protein
MLPQTTNNLLLEFKGKFNALLKANKAPAYAEHETNQASENALVALINIADLACNFSYADLLSLSSSGQNAVMLLNQLDNNQYSWVPNVFNQQSRDTIEVFKDFLYAILALPSNNEQAMQLAEEASSNEHMLQPKRMSSAPSVAEAVASKNKEKRSLFGTVFQKARSFVGDAISDSIQSKINIYINSNKKMIIAMLAIAEYKIALYNFAQPSLDIKNQIKSLGDVNLNTLNAFKENNITVVTKLVEQLDILPPLVILDSQYLNAPFHLPASALPARIKAYEMLLAVETQLNERCSHLLDLSDEIAIIEAKWEEEMTRSKSEAGSSSSAPFFKNSHKKRAIAESVSDMMSDVIQEIAHSRYAGIPDALIQILELLSIDASPIKDLINTRPLSLSM